jgi:hypothetical protein
MREKYAVYLNKAPIALAYARKIRNAEKKRYAMELVHWLCNPYASEPQRGALSYMGQQAVDMEVYRLMVAPNEPERLRITANSPMRSVQVNDGPCPARHVQTAGAWKKQTTAQTIGQWTGGRDELPSNRA